MEATRTPRITGLQAMGSGVRILSIEERINSKPMISTATDTRSPEIYSIRPWPKGCSVSGFWPESLKPTRVMREEPASERLLKASCRDGNRATENTSKPFSDEKADIQTDSHGTAQDAVGLAYRRGIVIFVILDENTC